jgi:signal transduction histidine kinase
LDTNNKSFNLTKQFALLSFICIVLIGTVSTFMLSKLITEKILLRDAMLSKDFIDSAIAADGTWKLFLNSSDINKQNNQSTLALESFFTQVALMPDVVRTNVYGSNRSVLWSSTPALIGKQYKKNAELDAALKGDLIFQSGVIGVNDKTEHSHFDETMRDLRFIETYIPVWNQEHNEIVGVVELYRFPRMLHQSIIEGQRFIWTGALIGGLLLFISLYWIVNRASMVMEDQQQRLLEAKSLSVIGQTASAITHAMRNPLASIRACAELSLTDDLEGVRESAMDIMNETDRLDRWARELLQFSSTNIETPQYLDMNNLVKDVVREHEPVAKRTGISLHLKMTDSSLTVRANTTPLSQVFGNLIMNAVEAMDGHGELTIDTFLDSYRNHFTVRFTDNGPGLPKEIQDRLFQPFITTKSTGTGLGLALSRHLVEHYHGILTIESEPGLGVTVTVSLPITGAPA